MDLLSHRWPPATRIPALFAARENEPVVSTQNSVQHPGDDGHFLMTDSRQDDFTAVDQIRSLVVSALGRRQHTSSSLQNAGALLDLLSADTKTDASATRVRLEEAVSGLPEVARMLRKVPRPRDDSAGLVVRRPNRADDAPPSSAGR